MVKARLIQRRAGAAIRKRRESLDFSQEGFADHIKMHRAYYGAIERGQKNLQLSTLERICKGLRTKPSEVLKDTES